MSDDQTTQKKQDANGQLPPPGFSSLVLSIASAAVLKMGLDPNKKEEKDLTLARYNIDLLDLLKEKTKNNLSKEEKELLDSCVSDLQIQFVNVQNQEKRINEKIYFYTLFSFITVCSFY